MYFLRSYPTQRVFFYDTTILSEVILPNLKHSLSLTLQQYLPLAGNLIWPTDSGKPIVQYVEGDKVSLTIAESDADFYCLSSNSFLEANQVISYIPYLCASDTKAPVMALQVTLFPKVGFSIGYVSHHGVVDGKTMSMFMHSWAFLCRKGGNSVAHKNCPKYKAQVQSSDTAATAVMADEDEIDVLLVASDDGKSDWVLDSSSAYHLCRDREVFSTYAACEGRIWMANNMSSRVVGRGSVRFRMADGSFEASGGILRVSKGNKEMLWEKKTRGLYRLEGNVQTGRATVRYGSSGISEKNGQRKQPLHRGTQSKRKGTWGIRNGTWRIRSGTKAQGDALGYVRKFGQTRVVQPVQDVHRKAQRKETKSILRSCTAKGAVTPKRVSFALDLISGGVLSSCAHKGGEMEPRQLANGKWSSPLTRLGISDAVLQSYEGAGSEAVRKDNLKISDYPLVDADSDELVGEDGVAIVAKAIAEAIRSRDRVFNIVGSPHFAFYNMDFGFGRPTKADVIIHDASFSLSDSRDGMGGIEVGLALRKHETEAFASLFTSGLDSYRVL
ncbi:HXXXD-type acyl-transferase family protein [Actinidia rufa]|uniref:HXXXD-type acyl-transferase family protein n=1 Tax=Actinidia rufa TaxID=165716 RepID=A0A7J0H802_9ERIC|nr:HXXXD-type acyl-transferase family protein [Actinidia rufa]